MSQLVEEGRGRRLALSVGDVTGALGDSVTVLPLVVALGALTPVSVPRVLLWFGVFQVVWGVAYGVPLSVEPMKALAALAIGGALSPPELAAAGLFTGGVLVVAGRAGLVGSVRRLVGGPVVRGVQLAVALVLARTALGLVLADPTLAAVGTVVALVVAAAGVPRAGALAVLGLGVGLAVATAGVPTPAVPTLPALRTATSGLPFPWGGVAMSVGALEGSLAQLATSVGNAAVATSALCAQLFDREVAADDLAGSMGAMTLVSVPLGGLPMCHGSGGLAGKHAFGARTWAANLVLGGLYLVGAVVAGIVTAIPTALLGVLLVVVAVHLGRSALSGARRGRALAVGVGLLGLVAGIGVAFVGGVLADRALAVHRSS